MVKQRAVFLVVFVGAPLFCGAQSLQNVVLRNSFNPIGAGSRGTGMGGAFIAVADDGTAASFNPAGLAQLRRSELALVLFNTWSTAKLIQPDALVTDVEKARENVPEFIGLALPFDAGSRRLTLQLSYQRAVDLFGKGDATVIFPENALSGLGIPSDISTSAAPIVKIDSQQSGAFHTLSVAAGLELTSRLSVGGAVNYWIGSWTAAGEQKIQVPLADVVQDRFLYDRRAVFDQEQKMRGINGNIGMLLRYPKLSIGGVIRFAFDGNYRLRESIVESTEGTGRAYELAKRNVLMNSRLRWPRSGGVGMAYRPARRLTFAVDFTRAEWSRAVIEDVPSRAFVIAPLTGSLPATDGALYLNRNFFDLSPASETLTKDTSQARLGVEYLLVLPKFVIPVRAGVFEDYSPVPDLGSVTTNPETAKGRRIRGLTTGLGLNFDRFVLDFAYEIRRSEGAVGFRFGEEAVVPRPIYPRERVLQGRLVVSAILRLGNTADDPIRRLLRAIFVGARN